MNTFTLIKNTHIVVVILFMLIYLVKTILLLANKNETLANFTKKIKVPEMIISTLFLLTGIYMLTQIPEIKSLMIIKIVAVLVSIPLAVIGFKKQKKALAVIAFLLIVGAYGLAEMSKKQRTSVVVPPALDSINGQTLYTTNCSKCHGDDGKLGVMGSTDLSVSPMSLDEKIVIIKKGKDPMTPFEGLLSDEQIKAVAEYTETLK